MPSLSSKDRVSLCRFTFDDGRRCRTPRVSTSPHFCFYHAQKEAQFRASENLAEDLAYFFSGDYLSANDLNTALSRVFVAVARGDLKPRAARTLAYLAQTMFQTLHLAQNEFITACGEKDWRHTVVQSINSNHDYRFPEPIEPPAQPTSPQAVQPQPPSVPSMPNPPQTQAPPQSPIPSPTPAPTSTPAQSAAPPVCHPERSEGPRLDSPSTTTAPTASPVGAGLARPEPSSTHPASQSTSASRPATQTRASHAVHYNPNDRLPVDPKPS